MPADIKFCGLTRAEDVAEAVRLGARYIGAIFAGGPRLVSAARAAELFAAVSSDVRRVGVFGAQSPEEIGETAAHASLDIVQLHGDPTADAIERVRQRTERIVWAVARIDGDAVPPNLDHLFTAADAVVLDARVPGALGGTGRSFDWRAVADRIADLRGSTPLVLAGGLTATNVAQAIDVLRPDVVDVSSGVESAPGIKDHAKMRAFGAAVRQAGVNR